MHMLKNFRNERLQAFNFEGNVAIVCMYGHQQRESDQVSALLY